MSRFFRRLLAILILALVARAAMLVYAERQPGRFDYPDSHRYLRVARNIEAGRGPMETEQIRAGTDPLYPAILAIGIRLGFDPAGSDDALMRFGRIVNTVFGVIGVALLAALGRRLIGDAAGLIAAAVLAVDPILLFFDALVLTETCYITLLLAAFYCLSRPAERRPWLWVVGAGLLLGLGTATRSTSLFLPLLMTPLVWLLARTRGYSDASRPAPLSSPAGTVQREPGPTRGCVCRHGPLLVVCFLAASIIPLLPTIVRNYALFGHLVPVRTGGGASLMEALGPWADGGPGMDRIVYPAFPAGANEHERDRLCRSAALDWARRHPAQVLRLAWIKLQRTWSVTINAPGYSSSRYTWIAWLTVLPEFVLAACGLWLLRRRYTLAALLLIVPIYFTLIHMVFVGSVRYRLPAMPFLFLAAGAGAAGMWRSLTGRSAAVSPTTGSTEASRRTRP